MKYEKITCYRGFIDGNPYVSEEQAKLNDIQLAVDKLYRLQPQTESNLNDFLYDDFEIRNAVDFLYNIMEIDKDDN